ncbi:MAG: exosortase [Pseudomonadota bacterium]
MTGASVSAVPLNGARLRAIGPAILFAAAWLCVYGPDYFRFAALEWTRPENAHAPFIMAICAATAWSRLSHTVRTTRPNVRDSVLGGGMLLFGFVMLLAGRASEATLIVSASQTVVAAGAAIAILGVAGATRLWFPILLTLYLVIWPGWAIDAATAPLKQAISQIVSDGLYFAGLPVSHAGAVIAAGQYQLLVADACAGLNSLIALTSIGAVYLYIVRRRSVAANLAVIALLAPIAIVANIARVTLLVLITYYFGYDAGQSFLHEAAGLFMFAVALASVFAVDAAAARIWESRP